MERSREEERIYNLTKAELANEKDPTVWEQKNNLLRRLGLRSIPMPDDFVE